MPTTAKRSAKDSVFRDFFSQREHLLALYKVLHPEDTQVTLDMLGNVTIENVLTDQLYNDLGFTVGDRLLILVEAQSTWSVNIIVRAFMYMAQSYQERFESQKINIYSSTKINLPEPELYVIYTGSRKERPKELTLSDSFFDGRKTAIEVTVKMLYGEDTSDVIGQYVSFCKVLDSQTKEYGYSEKAIQETIRICKDKNVLKSYLESREKEVTGIMMALFDDEYIREAFGREKFDAGEAKGRTEGRAEGKDEQARETAMNMHEAGFPNSAIAKMIGYAENVVASWFSAAKA